MKTRAVILAAGLGTRMRSAWPKVLHPLAGRPLIWYSIDAVRQATGELPVVVIGHGADKVRQEVGEAARLVVQEEQLGTGHAVQQAEGQLRDECDLVLAVNADNPLLTGATLKKLVQAQMGHSGPVSLLTVKTEKSRGFGRVVRDPNGGVSAIVEEAHASPEQLEINEFNVGAYCFTASWLWDALHHIPLSPKGEYYLTDMIQVAVSKGHAVQAITLEDASQTIGINSRVHLAEAEAILRERINRHWMLSGVTLIDPLSTYIDSTVTIGQDTQIHPNTYLQGETHIGKACTLGPNSIIRDTRLGERCSVFSSVLEQATLENDVDIGPFGHLRKGAHLADGVDMGNFGEVKNAYLGPGTKMGHFSYIGDAHISNNVNIGAGTITCNYDGRRKYRTEIGEGAFIGSDTMLVAPVKIGEGAETGAGAVVTEDVPPHTLVVGVPARPIKKTKESE